MNISGDHGNVGIFARTLSCIVSRVAFCSNCLVHTLTAMSFNFADMVTLSLLDRISLLNRISLLDRINLLGKIYILDKNYFSAYLFYL